MDELFEKAARKKVRFSTKNGSLSTEDLWDLSLTSLDTLAKALNKEVKESEEESFIKTRTAANKLTDLKFEIVKHIINVKLKEEEEKETRAVKAAQKEKIMTLIAEKQDEGLKSKSIEDLQAELAKL